ncbi:MAG: diaminohydroxyphosphoribosylaminopyrimidine reductase [Candidatus Nitrosocaldaceae archaeon]|nr:MAG: diaminohydroxyphosphoribosylaminopyrimidine reductase [Candidatus Nitrosocaldaceae archaeon]
MENYKPYVILNAAMSLDGKIATKTYDSKLSSEKDLTRVHYLRSKVDAIMVGINTVIRDNPLLTVRYGYNGKPIRIVIDSNARIDINSKIMRDNDVKNIVVISEKGKDRIKELKSYADVIISGRDRVDLKNLMHILYARGIRKVLLEGGGELNWSMFANRLIDEVIVTIEPVIVGGRDAITLVEGEGFEKIEEGIKLSLKSIDKIDDEVILRYQVL